MQWMLCYDIHCTAKMSTQEAGFYVVTPRVEKHPWDN